MTLQPGIRLGPYEVLSALGAGGMGEVYRARDTRLDRMVAIKILPDVFARDPDRLARFHREAQLLASLNHPHIGAIYGLEESNDIRALVLELVEGPTLAECIALGPIPLEETLSLARQIADALEAAHERGIVHRDLKPANIKLTARGAPPPRAEDFLTSRGDPTPARAAGALLERRLSSAADADWTVKVLDFGLAKALETGSGSGDVSQSPTITSPAMTRMGVVLGTAAYMSPEQARGHQADKRSDVWAFGCVLYEMLAGRRAFLGDEISDTMAAVLRAEPDWAALPAEVPEPIATLLRRCLEKDRKRRLRDIGDARLELDARGESAALVPVATVGRRKERYVWLAVVGVLSLVALSLGALAVRKTPAPPTVRVEINTPPVSQPEDLASLTMSPDGQALAFVAAVDGQPHLWVRRLDLVKSRPLPGTGGAAWPFWSPDSRSVAFNADGRLKRIDLDGGLVRTLTPALWGGGAWNRDGVMLYPANPASAIFRTSASSGGAGTAVTRLDTTHAGHSFPLFLPDGRHFLYYVNASAEARGVWLGQLDGSAGRRLFDADSAPAYTSGHILFLRQKTVLAQAFDIERLELKGMPFPVEEGVMAAVFNFGPAAITAAAGGTIAFRVGSASADRQFVWVDRSGKEIRKVGNPDNWTSPSPSPDLGQLAVLKRDATGNADVWLLETRRGVLTRFTTHPAEDVFPVWSHDGSRIAFQSNRDGAFGLYQKRTTDVASEELLLNLGGVGGIVNDWSPDGQFLLYQTFGADMGTDLWVLPLHGGRKPFPVIQTESDERDGQFSPDSKWIAYQSSSSGRFEVYLRLFPGPGAATQVSTGGGAQVRWRPDGRALFYIGLDGRLMEVPVQVAADNRPVLGIPVALFTTRVGYFANPAVPGAQYVVSADGQQFLMNNIVQEGSPTPVRLILNWKPTP